MWESVSEFSERVAKGACANRARLKIIPAVAVLMALLMVVSCTTESTPAPTPTPITTTEYFEIGEWAETSQQLLRLNSAGRTTSFQYYVRVGVNHYPIVEAAPGTVFIVIKCTVVNPRDIPLELHPDPFVIIDSEGRRYGWKLYNLQPPPFGYDTQDLPLGEKKELAPGGTTEGNFLFQVPEIATGLTLSAFVSGTPRLEAIYRLES